MLRKHTPNPSQEGRATWQGSIINKRFPNKHIHNNQLKSKNLKVEKAFPAIRCLWLFDN